MEINDIERSITELMDIYIEITSMFACSKCGQCCKASPNLLFSDEYILFDRNIIYWKDGLCGMKNPCPFCADNKCKIHYAHKPRMCRFAPFIINNKMGQIVLSNCELAKKISDKYNIFLKESSLDIADMPNPFTNIQLMIEFLDWLRQNNN